MGAEEATSVAVEFPSFSSNYSSDGDLCLMASEENEVSRGSNEERGSTVVIWHRDKGCSKH